jgi:peroxiredoxin
MKLLTFLLLTLLQYHLIAQISYRFSISDKVFYKETGEKITHEELQNILKENPGISFETVYNKYGEREKFLYDPNNIIIGGKKSRKAENQTQPGERFPEFVFKTLENDSIDSEKIKGKWVIIRFELFASLVNRDIISTIDEDISKSSLKEEIIPILCLADSRENVAKAFGSEESSFKFVSNAKNFHEMFNIVSFPTTVIIDRDGKVFKYNNYTESVSINELK